MNWPRTILDGTVMALLFNAVVGLGFLLYPQAYSTMFPKEIRSGSSIRCICCCSYIGLSAPFSRAYLAFRTFSGPGIWK